MGHTLGFMSSTAGMDAWANPRLFFLAGILPVSYTHLDVYKRQAWLSVSTQSTPTKRLWPVSSSPIAVTTAWDAERPSTWHFT